MTNEKPFIFHAEGEKGDDLEIFISKIQKINDENIKDVTMKRLNRYSGGESERCKHGMFIELKTENSIRQKAIDKAVYHQTDLLKMQEELKRKSSNKQKVIDQIEFIKMYEELNRKEKSNQSNILKKDFKNSSPQNWLEDKGRYKPGFLITFLSTVAFLAATTSLALTVISYI